MNGNPVVKSRMPPCRFCNGAQPAHFPLECTQAWEGWEIRRYPCYKCKRQGADHMPEECWVIRDCQQNRQELEEGLKVRAMQIEFCLNGNQCLICLASLKHNRHTVEDCLEDYSWELTDKELQVIPWTEVTWKIYEGDIEITQTWSHPSSGLRPCGFCQQSGHYTTQRNVSEKDLSSIPVCFVGRKNQTKYWRIAL